MELIVFVIVVIACIVCYKLSTSYNQHIEDKYYQGCINWLWSVITAVLAVITVGFAEDVAFYIFLVLTIVSLLLSIWMSFKRMIRLGATTKEARLGSAAQAASTVGIAAAIIFFLLLFFGGSNRKKCKR